MGSCWPMDCYSNTSSWQSERLCNLQTQIPCPPQCGLNLGAITNTCSLCPFLWKVVMMAEMCSHHMITTFSLYTSGPNSREWSRGKVSRQWRLQTLPLNGGLSVKSSTVEVLSQRVSQRESYRLGPKHWTDGSCLETIFHPSLYHQGTNLPWSIQSYMVFSTKDWMHGRFVVDS